MGTLNLHGLCLCVLVEFIAKLCRSAAWLRYRECLCIDRDLNFPTEVMVVAWSQCRRSALQHIVDPCARRNRIPHGTAILLHANCLYCVQSVWYSERSRHPKFLWSF